ncbi:MAG: DNA repair protein RadA, partial [Acidimicrobiales bacterium]
LDGGLTAGSVTLVGGEPGIGKSTLLLQVALEVAGSGRRVLYACGEEAPEQVKSRALRLGDPSDDLWLSSASLLPHVIEQLDQVKPDLLIVDSIQTLSDPDASGAPGTVTQIRGCAHRLVQEAKSRRAAVILVGHVTKDGNLAGPRTLEHVVDTVLAFEGDRHHSLRLLRAVKHRFGSTRELGLFEMTNVGLEAVSDPSRLFLADRVEGIPGSTVVPLLEGHRPLLVEVQALVSESQLANPRRVTQGLESSRLALLLAVLERRVGFPLSKQDVFASAVGGVKAVEPAVDLAIGLAVASSLSVKPLPPKLVTCGEVGLGGEIRQVGQAERRLAEASRLGFTTAIVPTSGPNEISGMKLIKVGTLKEAIAAAGLRSG